MGKIALYTFEARQPKVSKYLLGNNQAQTASNCNLETGALLSIKTVGTVQTQTGMTSPLTIYKLGANWIDFGNGVNVDLVRSRFIQTDDDIFYTDGTLPKKTTATDGTAGAKRLGIVPPTVDNALTMGLVTIDAVESTEVGNTVSYVYTYVSGDGEESVPSTATAAIDVPDNKYVALSEFISAVTAGNVDGIVTKIRIYRIAAGTSGAEYQYLTEQDHDTLIAAETFNDYVTDTGLIPVGDDVLATENWDAPPSTLAGLTEYANGMLAGFVGNTLYVSEPFIPYAFPAAYSIDFDDTIVAIAPYREALIVLTAEGAHYVTGMDPESLITQPIPDSRGCVAKKGVVVTPAGVAYPSTDGLELVTPTSVTLLTADVYTKVQWQALSIADFISFWYNGMYHGFFSGTATGIILTPTGVVDINLGTHLVYGGTVNPDDTKLYLLTKTGTTYYIKSFEGSATSLTYTFKTKKFTLPIPVNFACGKILKAPGTITFTYYVDEVLKSTQSITSEAMFRLPAEIPAVGEDPAYTCVGMNHEIQVAGATDIYAIIIATSPEELQIG